MARIVHLTSVHRRDDARIFLKQCRSLVAAGHDVTLIVADGRGNETKDDVRIIDVGLPRGRLRRFMQTTRLVRRKAAQLNADIYHLHDPELLPAGLVLKASGKRVVFDSHEDVPRQILSKSYLPRFLRRPLAFVVGVIERTIVRRLDHVVAATPAIRDKFKRMKVRTTDINNYPMLGELAVEPSSRRPTSDVCYVGGIVATRGIREIVAALALTRTQGKLLLAGPFPEAQVRAEVATMPGWSKVQELGVVDRAGVRDVLAESAAGLVTLHPTPAYLESLPVKMFEYMSAGLPVIASDFPLWRDIVEGSGCGVCVDPLDPVAIAAAIDSIVENPDMGREMGKNGYRAVHEKYNWAAEEKKLLALYDELSST